MRTIMGIYFLVAMSITCLQLGLEYENEKTRLGESISKIAETFNPIFAQAVWNLDDEQIQSTIDGVLLNEYVLGLKLLDEDNNVLASKGYNNIPEQQAADSDSGFLSATLASSTLTKHYEYSFDIVFNSQFRGSQKVATMILYSSSNQVLDHAAYTFFITIINAIIKTLFLWFIAFIIIQRIIAKPMTQITHAINELNPNSKSTTETENELSNSYLASKKDELGILVRAFLAMKDALLRRNKEILEYQSHLEDKVVERTKELEKASQAKSEFLANMSHEIRTPMNGVLGMVELLQDTSLNDTQKQYVNTVQNSGNALLAILNDILDYSKIEAGKLALESISFDLEEMIDECAFIFAFKANEQHLQFVASMAPDTPTLIYSDPTRLRQVLMNLLGNAFKFTEHGEINLRVSCIEKLDDGDMIYKFAISDTGIGLSEEHRKQLFKSFSQADSSTTRKYGGTGLGLAISKELSSLLGGEIGVESEAGKGSTFWFTIKVRPAQMDLVEQPKADISILADKRVLIIDDHPTFNEVMCSRLSAWKMQPEVAQNAKEALSKIAAATNSKTPYHLILLDFMMPEINGIELARQLRKDNLIEHSELILISAVRGIISDSLLAEMGIEYALEKPISRRELEKALVKSLGGKYSTPAKKQGPTETKDFSHLHLLLAEDNKVNQMVAKGLLAKLGITPDIANNGREALDNIKATPKPYDVVLMDVEMPELDGWGATREIRKQQVTRKNGDPLYIIALSAHAMADKREHAAEIGMNDFLAKPVKMRDLNDALSKVQ
ncbi:MAG: response regulator [Pseudomonadales bacterium]|nr:response regulator [Pseudomonadales bacterium]